jgi:hypothetical protein
MTHLLAVLLAQSVLVYKAPAGTDAKTVEKAALVMERRVKDYGYKGVLGSTDGTNVRLIFESGFTTPMIQVIDRLAVVQGQCFLWGIAPMNQTDYEQWIPEKTCPKGTSWLVGDNFKWIMDNSWKVQLDAKFERRQQVSAPEPQFLLVFSRGAAKKHAELRKANPGQRSFAVMLDGKLARFPNGKIYLKGGDLHTNDANGEVTWCPDRNYDVDIRDHMAVMIAIANPLPVVLSGK